MSTKIQLDAIYLMAVGRVALLNNITIDSAMDYGDKIVQFMMQEGIDEDDAVSYQANPQIQLVESEYEQLFDYAFKTHFGISVGRTDIQDLESLFLLMDRQVDDINNLALNAKIELCLFDRDMPGILSVTRVV